jgi:ABC-type branched-subunit amino acid transport system permease subunit
VGYKDALVTFVGALLGAITFILLQPWLKTTLLSMPPQAKLTLDGILNWPFTTAALLLMLIFGAILFILEWYRPWKEDMRGL